MSKQKVKADTVYLNDLISVSKDGEWGQGEAFNESVEMYAIRGTDFEDVRLGNITDVPRRHIAKQHAERKQLQPYDVLIEAAGGTKNQITGRTVLLRPSLFSRSDLPLTCASFSRFIRFNTKLCDPVFMFWYLQYLYASGFMNAYHTQHTGVSRFQWTTFSEREPITIPSLSKQRRLASILSAYDDLIENNARRIAILEESAQRLYREWFVHFRFPGHEKVKMVDSEIGLIPKGWDVAPINDNIKTDRKTIRRNELSDDMIYVGIEHIPRKKMIIAECSTASTINSDKLLFSSGDVLFGKIRAYFHKIAIAPFEGCCSTDVIVMKLSTQRYAFDYLTLFSDDFIAYATQISQGTKMPRAEWNVLKEYKCVSPAQSVIEQFNKIIFPVIEEVQILARKNANLRRTRDLLLPQLISGRLNVSELDIKVA